MVMAASMILSLAIFSLGLIVQSRILLDPDEQKHSLATILTWCSIIALVLGISLIVIGFKISVLRDSFVSIGFILMIVGIVLFIERSVILDPSRKLGLILRRYAFVCWGASVVALLALIISLLVRAL